MNASPVSTSASSSLSVRETSPARRRSVRSLLGTLTGICFVFGALMAVQVRTITNLQTQRERQQQGDALQKERVEQNRLASEKATKEAQRKSTQLAAIVNDLRKTNGASDAQIKALLGQIRDLQALAGLTSVNGPGLRIVLSDDPQAAKAGGDSSMPLPGLVHDYDVLQVVNELRAAKADAIAVSGAGGKPIRISGTTPIRCVGPVIFINWKPVAAPFAIEAVGDAATLKSAVEMPGGIVENMRTQGAVGVKVQTSNSLSLPPIEGAPVTLGTTSIAAPSGSLAPDSMRKGA